MFLLRGGRWRGRHTLERVQCCRNATAFEALMLAAATNEKAVIYLIATSEAGNIRYNNISCYVQDICIRGGVWWYGIPKTHSGAPKNCFELLLRCIGGRRQRLLRRWRLQRFWPWLAYVQLGRIGIVQWWTTSANGCSLRVIIEKSRFLSWIFCDRGCCSMTSWFHRTCWEVKAIVRLKTNISFELCSDW